MKRYYGLNNENRIISTTDLNFPQQGQQIYDFPADFDFSKQFDYKLIGGELIYDEYVPIPTAEEQIAELKSFLSDTDYVVIKIAEGAATAEEYAEVIQKRQDAREKINELEA